MGISKVRRLAVVVAGLALSAVPVLAGTEPEPLEITGLSNVINVSSLGAAIAALAGAALVVAFTVGGGFRIAKKAYRWIMGKVG